MKKDMNIDELLNGYIDGELSQRHQTEVQRLINHDPAIVQRLRELDKCKTLVNSLPRAQAPAGLLEDVKASLERRALLGLQSETFDQQAGARDLLVRKVLTVAAMIALVAVLGTVIYTIVAPDAELSKPIAANRWELPTDTIKDEHTAPIMAASEFSGRLELKTADFSAVNAAVRKAIEENGLLEKVTTPGEQETGRYSVKCSRKSLSLLLVDLESLWEKFDSATLFVDISDAGAQIAVDTVTAKQIAEIVNQDSCNRSVEVAKILAGSDPAARDLIIIPKPVMTGNVDDTKKINLTIVVKSEK